MNRFIYALFLFAVLFSCNNSLDSLDLITPFETSDSLETCTYEEGILWWNKLAESSPFVGIERFGETDIGKPLHLITIDANNYRSNSKTTWLINNGIHPGEPDGIDASMLFIRELISSEEFEEKYKDITILIIPFYNVGGAINRNCCSRSNQNGPISYGFRGNAKNLDLNRDFIKMDSKNAQSFAQLIDFFNPDIYLETHVSNGADYPYTMTYLLSHPDKITPPLSQVMSEMIKPGIEMGMSELGDDIVPYVNVHSASPDSGYTAFYDSPRYSTGYLTLHNCLALLTETHMLKPFSQRVSSTLRFLNVLGNVISKNAKEIKRSRVAAIKNVLAQDFFVLDWETDYNRSSPLKFKGYKAYFDTSEVTKLAQLYYNSDSVWEREIPYFNHLIPAITVRSPLYYLVPQSWSGVVERLKWNGVEMNLLDKDTMIECVVYSIVDYESNNMPYEGHYFHKNTKIESNKRTLFIRKNEYFFLSTNQISKRFIIETLEPQGPDSYFNWNFYDEILQQKEWFSSYVFDQEAAEMLKGPATVEKLDSFLVENPLLKNDANAQLYYLYKMSKHYEKDKYLVYPVFRIE